MSKLWRLLSPTIKGMFVDSLSIHRAPTRCQTLLDTENRGLGWHFQINSCSWPCKCLNALLSSSYFNTTGIVLVWPHWPEAKEAGAFIYQLIPLLVEDRSLLTCRCYMCLSGKASLLSGKALGFPTAYCLQVYRCLILPTIKPRKSEINCTFHPYPLFFPKTFWDFLNHIQSVRMPSRGCWPWFSFGSYSSTT